MLPSLRRELTLLEGSPSVTGEPRWLIHDPLQHRYIQIDEVTYLVLAVWSQCRTVDELLERVEASGRSHFIGGGANPFLLPEFELEDDLREWVEDNVTWLFEFQLAAWRDGVPDHRQRACVHRL